MFAFAINIIAALHVVAAPLCPAVDDPLAALKASHPSDFAVAVRATRLFESMEPYAKILGRVEPGDFYPVVGVTEDQYGIVWAEVALEDGSAYLSDVIVVREREPVLRGLLQKVDLADIGMWDDEVLESVQARGVEVGFTATQLLFAQGLPLLERVRGHVGQDLGEGGNSVLKEWFYPRLVVLLEGETVVGYTTVERLVRDRSIEFELAPEEPDFTAVGSWESRTESDGVGHMHATSGKEVGRFRVQVPVKGTYRLSARWISAPENSSEVIFEAKKRGGGEEGDEQQRQAVSVARMKANQRLNDRRWIELGLFDVEPGSPLVIEMSSADGKPFDINALRLEYVNDPVLPSDAGEAADDSMR